MDKLRWTLLTEVYDRLEAEMLKAALEAQDIPAQLFQEGAGQLYPVAFGQLGRIQIFIPQENAREARAWLDAYERGALEDNIPGNTETP